MPAVCPRVKLRIMDSPLPEGERIAGEGSLDQVHRDLAGLEELGCTYVLLDTFYDDIEAVRRHETSWRMLSVMAEKVVDLASKTVR